MQHIDPQLLRNRHPHFYYREATYLLKENGLELSFTFELENGPVFSPTIFFPTISKIRFSQLNSELIQEWVFQIGLVEMLSYWKSACSPKIIIQAGYLEKNQLTFWRSLLQKGLSEFFFVNQIDGWQEDFVQLEVTHEPTHRRWSVAPLTELALIPVGGGKDSIVSLELGRELDIPVSTMTLNITSQVQQLLAVAGNFNHYNIQRTLDPKLLDLNQSGYLNGHTPFSAMLAFISTFAGVLYDFKYVVLSNEWSANEGNTVFLGQTINHQYSKSFEFEVAFSEYLKNYLTPEVIYFSWLRPLHEVQIALLFSKYPQYFSTFLSCNRGQKEGKWCGTCPKCLFVFILLSAFLPKSDVQKIWGHDLFKDLALQEILAELTGKIEVKSLECVGTRQESLYALALALKREGSSSVDGLWQKATEMVGDVQKVALEADQFMKSYQDDRQLPDAFKQVLITKIRSLHD